MANIRGKFKNQNAWDQQIIFYRFTVKIALKSTILAFTPPVAPPRIVFCPFAPPGGGAKILLGGWKKFFAPSARISFFVLDFRPPSMVIRPPQIHPPRWGGEIKKIRPPSKKKPRGNPGPKRGVKLTQNRRFSVNFTFFWHCLYPPYLQNMTQISLTVLDKCLIKHRKPFKN